MAYEMTGKVKIKEETQTFGSGFSKMEFVLTVEDGKYPQDIKLEIVQDNISKMDAVNVGDEICVTFDIRGNEHNGKYYNNLQAWKLNKLSASEAPPASAPPAADEDSEIPF